MRKLSPYVLTATTSATDSSYKSYDNLAKSVNDIFSKNLFKDLEVRITKKRDKMRKEKKEHMFNPDNLDLEGEQ